jgi:hypothetical protein
MTGPHRLGPSDSVWDVSMNDALQARLAGLVAAHFRDGGPAGGGDDRHGADLVTQPAVIRSGTAVVYIRLIDAEPPVLRLFSPVLRQVDRTPDLLSELNDLNARLSFLRLFWRDGTVFAAAELLAEAVQADAFTHAFETLADAADFYDEHLEPRFGGQKAYSDRSE